MCYGTALMQTMVCAMINSGRYALGRTLRGIALLYARGHDLLVCRTAAPYAEQRTCV